MQGQPGAQGEKGAVFIPHFDPSSGMLS
jgi:hypothetical protein